MGELLEQEGRHSMKVPTLAEIKCVLGAPFRQKSRRAAVGRAQVDFGMARADFVDRATPRRWEILLAASRRLHRDWLKDQKEAPVHHAVPGGKVRKQINKAMRDMRKPQPNRREAIERLAKALKVTVGRLVK